MTVSVLMFFFLTVGACYDVTAQENADSHFRRGIDYFKPQILENMRKAAQEGKRPPQQVTPKYSQEAARLVDRINENHKDSLFFAYNSFIVKGQSVVLEEDFTLVKRSLVCDLFFKFVDEDLVVEDCDKKRNKLEWKEMKAQAAHLLDLGNRRYFAFGVHTVSRADFSALL
jgi:hypothetical protein